MCTPKCFWDDCDQPGETTIYWDGVDEPICTTHLPEAQEAVQEILHDIDERIFRN